MPLTREVLDSGAFLARYPYRHCEDLRRHFTSIVCLAGDLTREPLKRNETVLNFK